MRCSALNIEGHRLIVCGSQRIPVCGCGSRGDLLCDWKTGRDKTCDQVLCAECTTSPADGKDLCPFHATSWATDDRNAARIVP